ncbi:hypothetical protein GCM10025762_15030 [Haloechinothrix salitolerans]
MTSRNGHKVPGISVYRRGKTWAYAVSTGSDVVTGQRQRIYQGGFETDDDAWQAALQHKTNLARGRTITARNCTVDQFLTEWLTSVEHSVKPSTYATYKTNINTYIRPGFGRRKLRDVSVPMLNTFYRRLLAPGRVKTDTNVAMYEYWRTRGHLRDGKGPTPTDVSTACGTTILAAKAALRRYRRGRTPSHQEPDLSPKSIRNIHQLLHSAFRDAVAWQYSQPTPPSTPASHEHPAQGTDPRRGPWRSLHDGLTSPTTTASPACGYSPPPPACAGASSPLWTAEMRSHTTREFLAGVAIAQQFGRPGTPTDQAWIETLFGHVKSEWPHLEKIRHPGELEAELELRRHEYNAVRLTGGPRSFAPTFKPTPTHRRHPSHRCPAVRTCPLAPPRWWSSGGRTQDRGSCSTAT